MEMKELEQKAINDLAAEQTQAAAELIKCKIIEIYKAKKRLKTLEDEYNEILKANIDDIVPISSKEIINDNKPLYGRFTLTA